MSDVATVVGSLAAAAVDGLGSVDGRWLLLALACQPAHLLLRAVAWRNAIAAAYPDRRVPHVGLGAAYLAGVALNSFAPARAGEAAKIALARMQVPRSSVATIAAAGVVVLVVDLAMTAAFTGVAWSSGVVPPLDPAAVPAFATLTAHPVAAGAAAALAGAALVVGARRLRGPLGRLRTQLRDGVAVLASPGRYLRDVASFQLAAWMLRLAVAFSLLSAFGLEATLPLAALVVVAGGLSTLVPVTPGGIGTQQALLALALHETASTASAISFSVAMQATLVAINTAVGLAALMSIFGTARPLAAARAGRAALRGR